MVGRIPEVHPDAEGRRRAWNEFNFRFDANGSPSEFLIKEVRVTKVGSPGR